VWKEDVLKGENRVGFYSCLGRNQRLIRLPLVERPMVITGGMRLALPAGRFETFA